MNPALFTPAGPGLYTTNVPDVISGQINVFSGGNKNLRVEESSTLTVGGVYQPSFIEGLALTIDWYKVDIDDPISSLDADVILKACYSPNQNPTGDPLSLLCSLVRRNTATGGLVGTPSFGLDETERNIGFLISEGIDISVDYLVDVGSLGDVDITFQATHILKINDQPTPISPTTVCKGLYGSICDSPNSSTRFQQRTNWGQTNRSRARCGGSPAASPPPGSAGRPHGAGVFPLGGFRGRSPRQSRGQIPGEKEPREDQRQGARRGRGQPTQRRRQVDRAVFPAADRLPGALGPLPATGR